MNKKKYIIIVICILLLILIALVLFRLFSQKNSQSSNVNDRERLHGVYITDDVAGRSSFNVYSQRCTESNICIDSMVITYDGEKGTIQYTVSNQGTDEKSGYLLVTIEDHSFLFEYHNLDSYETQDGIFGYDGFSFDFSNLSYLVRDGRTEDLEAIYNNDSCTEQGDHTYMC